VHPLPAEGLVDELVVVPDEQDVLRIDGRHHGVVGAADDTKAGRRDHQHQLRLVGGGIDREVAHLPLVRRGWRGEHCDERDRQDEALHIVASDLEVQEAGHWPGV
jgi:hypothetical protein